MTSGAEQEVTFVPQVQKGHCPQCGPNRSSDVKAWHQDEWEDETVELWGRKTYFVLQCRGCEATYVQTVEVFSEDVDFKQLPNGEFQSYLTEKVDHWPAPTRREQPSWTTKVSVVDSDLGALFEDIYGALNSDLRVPAAISMRTVIDRSSELLGVDTSLGFAEKLSALVAQGKISGDEKDALGVLVDAGSAAAHRGWRPSPADLEIMMLLTEAFVHRSFVLGDAAKDLKHSIPARPKRTKPIAQHATTSNLSALLDAGVKALQQAKATSG